MTIVRALAFLALLAYTSVNFASEVQPFNAVQKLFAAMSARDHQAMRDATTDDFQLLEVGEVWTLQSLIDVVKPGQNVRRNFFDVIKTVSTQDNVWISYWNKAEITGPETNRTVVWLESVVVVKQAGKWKLQMMHSTKLAAENYPSGINYQEYVE